MQAASPPADATYSRVFISQLREGSVLSAPIYGDARGQKVLLLAAGAQLTKSRLDRLRARGIATALVHSSDLDNIVENRREKQPPETTEEKPSTVSFDSARDPFFQKVKDHGSNEYEQEQLRQMAGTYSQTKGKVKDLFRTLADESGVDGNVAVHVTMNSLEEICEDLDLFVRLSIDRESEAETYNHGLKTARIALAIGTVLGLKTDELMDLGTGCLIHDIGMAKVDPALSGRKGYLSRIEFLDITKHPIHTFDMLRDVKDIPPRARVVAYQVHERWNGTGYPRRRRGQQIHPLARIAAVADAFAAMISDRPHRPAMTVQQAMAQVLFDTKQGLFDPQAVCGLLKAISLFPIGSVVEVSDGRVGIVVRANHDDYTHPIVELWSNDDFSQPGEIVDLSQTTELQITRSIAKADATNAAMQDLFEIAACAAPAFVE